MIRASLLRTLPAILGVLVMASCSDSGIASLTAPANAIAEKATVATIKAPGPLNSPTDGKGLELRAAWWDKQHKNLTIRQTITPKGGTILIPETGFSMSFPAGAVKAPVQITVSADEKYVAYKFEPTGQQFDKDVIITQSLAATEFKAQPLRSQLLIAYIDDNVKLSGKVPVLYLVPSNTIFSPLSPRIPQAQVWSIKHFSRYMLASG
ncbi:MAG TPA: hypothetical protein VD771_07855 [Gemmatimonadaceae bacterium]|nr:hypothetical protein [Gemmatimonadaceae bacterium]